MKGWVPTAAILISGLVGLPAELLAMNHPVDGATARNQVMETDNRRIDAIRGRDPRPLFRIYADDYTLVTPTGALRSKREQLRDLISGAVR